MRIRPNKEGWVEFKKKKHAKLAAAQLNAQPIEQTKKKSKFAGIMWNIKYLVRFIFYIILYSMSHTEHMCLYKMLLPANTQTIGPPFCQ